MGDPMLAGEYPDSWDEYVGQPRAKKLLITAVQSAVVRQQNLPHTLIASPLPGVGKTALAQLVLRMAGVDVHVVTGAINLARARIMFSQLQEGQAIYWDEFHKCMDGGKKNAEWLLHYLENGVLLTSFGVEQVPQVTIIGATTDKGIIAKPILDRMRVVDLQPYSDDEGAAIAAQLGEKVLAAHGLPLPSEATNAAIARAGSNQPRAIREILSYLRDLAVTGQIEAPDDGAFDLGDVLDMADVTADGLTARAREYLDIMFSEAQGEPVGEAYLKRRMGFTGNEGTAIEQLLVEHDLIRHTRQGRMLTAAGIRRAQELASAAQAA